MQLPKHLVSQKPSGTDAGCNWGGFGCNRGGFCFLVVPLAQMGGGRLLEGCCFLNPRESNEEMAARKSVISSLDLKMVYTTLKSGRKMDRERGQLGDSSCK